MQLWSLHIMMVPYKQIDKEIQYVVTLFKMCPPPYKEVSATLIPNAVFATQHDSHKTITKYHHDQFKAVFSTGHFL